MTPVAETPAIAHVELPRAIADEIVAHARAELPNEACGLIASDAPFAAGGHPLRWIPTRNVLASPYRFEIHPDDLLRHSIAIDDVGEVIWAIVHSHVVSPARPSANDLREARHPAALQLIVSLDATHVDAAGPDVTDAPSLRAWTADGQEIELTSS
ncbi:MAG: M67 family metallopeptidase [Chloroflexi bacterium]|nr:M67 family metallopeptidase [Chloroflexota bacterium]